MQDIINPECVIFAILGSLNYYQWNKMGKFYERLDDMFDVVRSKIFQMIEDCICYISKILLITNVHSLFKGISYFTQKSSMKFIFQCYLIFFLFLFFLCCMSFVFSFFFICPFFCISLFIIAPFFLPPLQSNITCSSYKMNSVRIIYQYGINIKGLSKKYIHLGRS